MILPIVANRFAPGLGNVVTNVLGGAFKSKGMKTTEATFAGIEQFMAKHPEMADPLARFLKRSQKKLGVDSFASKVLEHVKSNVVPTLPRRDATVATVADEAPPASPPPAAPPAAPPPPDAPSPGA